MLAGLLELEPEALLDHLAPAVVDGLLESEAPHAYRFAHTLFQAVLYEDLLPGQRVSLHRKLADLLIAPTATRDGDRPHKQAFR